MSRDTGATDAASTRGASLARRLGAMLYDGMLVLALWMVTLFPMVALQNNAVLGATVQTLLFLELYAFFIFFWMYRGQTLGMLAWKLAIVTNDGAPVTLRMATLRFFAAMLALLCFGLGYFWILLDPQRRSWSDMLSASRIVRV